MAKKKEDDIDVVVTDGDEGEVQTPPDAPGGQAGARALGCGRRGRMCHRHRGPLAHALTAALRARRPRG